MRTALLLALLVPLQAPADPVVTPTAPIALFNGHDLSNWEADVPARDTDPERFGRASSSGADMLVSLGTPEGHLVTKAARTGTTASNPEYRFHRQARQLRHCSCTPRARARSTRCSRSRSKCR